MGRGKIQLCSLDLPKGLKTLSYDECEALCADIRGLLINTVSKTGGHLASNLGTVELSLALHRVFDSPQDKIVWDVGHQAYTHKILTGRAENFSTLRQEGGISGFPSMQESVHDAFTAGHSSNSISAAYGIAEAMRMSGNTDNYAVAIIGDGALTGGLAYEGLNNAGKSDCNLIVILNDNNMSISKNVGALAKYLSNIRGKRGYLSTKKAVSGALDRMPVIGKPISSVLRNSKEAIKRVVYKNTMFEDLGFVYLGPVDGHNLKEIEYTLETAKNIKSPVFIHLNTIKGKGFNPAEKNPGAFHGISSQDISSLEAGNPEIISEDTYSAVFGKELCRLADKDKRICAITAAMKYGTGLQYFAAKHGDRFFDVGIAEAHAVTFASGLASMGKIPVFAVYSSFLQRAYDQLIHDAAISNSHIVLGIDRAGIVGEDGETHQGVFDVAMLKTVPGAVIFAPASYRELRLSLKRAIFEEKGITCIRYPRGNDGAQSYDENDGRDYTLIKNGGNLLAVSYGRLYHNLRSAAEEINASGGRCDILRLTKIFPLPDTIISEAMDYDTIVFFEEAAGGGIAELFAEKLAESGYKGRYISRAVCGFIKHAAVESAIKKLALDSRSMKELIESVL